MFVPSAGLHVDLHVWMLDVLSESLEENVQISRPGILMPVQDPVSKFLLSGTNTFQEDLKLFIRRNKSYTSLETRLVTAELEKSMCSEFIWQPEILKCTTKTRDCMSW